jgi:hypothetical protein
MNFTTWQKIITNSKICYCWEASWHTGLWGLSLYFPIYTLTNRRSGLVTDHYGTLPIILVSLGYTFQGLYEGVSKSFRTGRLERELEMVQISATRYSCIAILWVSPVNFVVMTLFIASEWVFIVVSVYFVVDSVRKLLDTPLTHTHTHTHTHFTRTVYHMPWSVQDYAQNRNKQKATKMGSFPGGKAAGAWSWPLISI